jgi:3-oxoacyl-[acyl-carrier-protein] synthase III
MSFSRIAGVGHYVPKRVVTNQELEKRMDTTDAWIQERTGIRERHFFDPDKDTVANMGAAAAQMALDRAGLNAQDVDFIVFATLSSDYYFPGSGVLMQRELGIPGIGALDIRTQCTGFIYSLSVADQFIKSGMYRRVLVVGSEIQSSIMNISNEGRAMAVIFGDGAGAAVLEATGDANHRILSTHLHADGRYAEELMQKEPGGSRRGRWMTPEMVEAGGADPYMNGSMVFKHAVIRFPEVIQEALDANGYEAKDLDLLIPHQANLRISEFVRQKLNLPEEKVFNNIQRYGNTTAGSIPIALSEAYEAGKIKPGSLVCLAAFGSGFTWASALLRW